MDDKMRANLQREKENVRREGVKGAF